MPKPPPILIPCPKCQHVGATSVPSIPFTPSPVFIFASLVPVTLDTPRDYLECDACGHIWTVPKLPHTS